MSRRIIIRPLASAGMEELADYLAEHNPSTSIRFAEACFADFDLLVEMPGIGAMREFQNPDSAGIRSWIVSGFPNHLIFYRPIDGGIEV